VLSALAERDTRIRKLFVN
jgi:hypothetical protein